MPERVCLYVRVSTDEQARHGYSLDDQRRVLREHARREGYEVVEELADEGDSGANPYRAGLLKIRELAESGEMDLVLATKHRIADGVMDLLGEEQRAEIARETRRGRMQRARSGEVVAGIASPPTARPSRSRRTRRSSYVRSSAWPQRELA
jgi:DNA invertase Pin-like site-specific DNA recombinase